MCLFCMKTVMAAFIKTKNKNVINVPMCLFCMKTVMTAFITKVLGVEIAILKDILFHILNEINLFKNTVSAVYYENA